MAQSIERAIELVNRASERPLSLSEAARALDVHKSTALRILQTLEASRFVRKTTMGTYVLGSGLIELAEQALGALDLRQFAGPYLRDLERETGLTVHLAQLTGDEVIYIDKVDSPSLDSIQLQSRIGRPVSLYASGVGKTILAYRSATEVARLLDGVNFVRHTATTFASLPELEVELKQIRERGWATDNGELHDFVNCVSVPIRNSNGDVVAALSLTAMRVLTPLPELMKHLPLLLSTAATLSSEIGYVSAA